MRSWIAERNMHIFIVGRNISEPYLMSENSKQAPKNIYDCLQLIRARPHMYIGSKSLKDLSLFIGGFRAAERISGINEHLPDFMDFHDFVAHQYKLTSSCEGWPKIIMKRNKENEELAWEDFYKLLDLFMEQSSGKRPQRPT